MKKFLFGMFLLTSSSLYAKGKEGGNGGDTVVCDGINGLPEKVELLDFHEANASYSRNKTIFHGQQRQEINKKIVEIVKNFDFYRGQKLSRFFEQAEKDISDLGQNPEANTVLISFSDTVLEDLKDEGDIISIPEGCRIRQLVYRRKEVSFKQARLIIYRKDFNILSPEEQSMTLAHEYLYGEAIDNGAINSMQTRLLNGIYYSNFATTLDPSLYQIYLNYSESKDLKQQFPFLMRFAGKDYEVATVYRSNEVETEERIKDVYTLKESNDKDKIANLVKVPLMREGKPREGKETNLFLKEIRTLQNSDRVIGIAESKGIIQLGLPKFEAANGSLYYNSSCSFRFELSEWIYPNPDYAFPWFSKVLDVAGKKPKNCIKINITKYENYEFGGDIFLDSYISITMKPMLEIKPK